MVFKEFFVVFLMLVELDELIDIVVIVCWDVMW